MEPWLLQLREGRSPAAWDLFIERYRRLILATIRRLVPDEDDVMDVFSTVCEALAADDCARLKCYVDPPARVGRPASVATWLVVVVRNLTIDWHRRQDGRRRREVPRHLSPVQQQIYAAVCLAGCSHVEAYESIRARAASEMSFEEFLRELRVTIRLAPYPRETRYQTAAPAPPPEATASDAADPAEVEELARKIAAAMASCSDDVRVAIELFVVEGMPAEEVARVVGWPNAKAVYNRVYRVLASMRSNFVRDGIGPGDL